MVAGPSPESSNINNCSIISIHIHIYHTHNDESNDIIKRMHIRGNVHNVHPRGHSKHINNVSVLTLLVFVAVQ